MRGGRSEGHLDHSRAKLREVVRPHQRRQLTCGTAQRPRPGSVPPRKSGGRPKRRREAAMKATGARRPLHRTQPAVCPEVRTMDAVRGRLDIAPRGPQRETGRAVRVRHRVDQRRRSSGRPRRGRDHSSPTRWSLRSPHIDERRCRRLERVRLPSRFSETSSADRPRSSTRRGGAATTRSLRRSGEAGRLSTPRDAGARKRGAGRGSDRGLRAGH